MLNWLCISYSQPEDESTTIRAQDTNYMTYLIMNQLQLHSSWLHVGCMVTIQVSQNVIQKKKEGAYCVVIDHGGIRPTPRTIPPQAWLNYPGSTVLSRNRTTNKYFCIIIIRFENGWRSELFGTFLGLDS